MKNQKAVRKHLLVLYLLFFAVVIISITGKIIPDIRSGFKAANRIETIIGTDSLTSESSRYFFLYGVEFEPYNSQIRSLSNCAACDHIEINAFVDRANLIVEQHVAPGHNCENTPLSLIGDNPLYYYASILVTLSYVAMLILIAFIISSLQRSVKRQAPVDKRNSILVRIIGSIIIVAEIITALIKWQMSLQAEMLLSHTNYIVNTLFNPDYMIIIIGILVLFTGELFSIAHSLGEEQKFTI